MDLPGGVALYGVEDPPCELLEDAVCGRGCMDDMQEGWEVWNRLENFDDYVEREVLERRHVEANEIRACPRCSSSGSSLGASRRESKSDEMILDMGLDTKDEVG